MGNEDITRIIAPFQVWENGTKTIDSSNSATRITTENTAIRMVRIKANSSNTGEIHIGSNNLTTTNSGLSLAAGEEANVYINNLKEVWVLATQAGDSIGYLFIR